MPEGSELLALVDGEEPGEGWKAVGFAEVGEGRTALLVHADDERLRRLAVLDAVINNGDRKGGHLLPAPEGRLFGIDHGVTFNAENKLRTLLWGWAGEKLTPEAVEVLERLRDALDGDAGRAPGGADHRGRTGRHARACGRAARLGTASGALGGVARDPVAARLAGRPHTPDPYARGPSRPSGLVRFVYGTSVRLGS